MQRYEIVLKNEKEKTYFIISWLLLASNFISILIFSVSMHFSKWGPFAYSMLAMACIFVPMYFKDKNEKITYGWAFFFFGLGWQSSPYDWLFYLNLLFGILDQTARRKLSVQVDKNYVVYPAVFQKRIHWKDISNIILKDDILTIDLKNNKIFQQLIDEKMQTVNEKEFNDFCREQLNQ